MVKAIQKLRPYPEKLSVRFEFIFSGSTLLLGLFMGLIAKMTDSVSVIGEIGTQLGIWVFAAAIVAAYSRYPLTAGINVLLFFLSMLFAYYVYGYTVLGFFSRAYFMGWLMIALLSPLAGVCAWFSKAKGIVGSIVTALPVAILFAEGYPAFYTSSFVLYTSLLLGIALCAVLPRTIKQKISAFVIAIPIAFLIDSLHLLDFLPF